MSNYVLILVVLNMIFVLSMPLGRSHKTRTFWNWKEFVSFWFTHMLIYWANQTYS